MCTGLRFSVNIFLHVYLVYFESIFICYLFVRILIKGVCCCCWFYTVHRLYSKFLFYVTRLPFTSNYNKLDEPRLFFFVIQNYNNEEPSNEDGLQRDPAAEIQPDEAVQLSGTAVLEENPCQPSTSAR